MGLIKCTKPGYREIESMSRPYRARDIGVTESQGVALGRYVLPFQGKLAASRISILVKAEDMGNGQGLSGRRQRCVG